MKLNNMSIGKRLSLGFSVIILLMLVMAIAVYISYQRIQRESEKQVMVNDLLSSNADFEHYLLEFISTGKAENLDSAKYFFTKCRNKLEVLKPVFTQKKYGIILQLEEILNLVEEKLTVLETSKQLISELKNVIDQESSMALSVAARYGGGETSKGVQQFLNIRILEKDYLLTLSEDSKNRWTAEIDDNIKLARMLGLSKIVRALESYKDSFIKYSEVLASEFKAEEEIEDLVNQSQYLLDKGVHLSAGILNDSVKHGLAMTIFTVVIVILISILIAYGITVSITKPVHSWVDLALNLSKGNLVVLSKEKSDRSDELGKLTRALSEMSEKLKEVISTIYISSNHIAGASEQLSSTSQQVSQGASEQASSAEEVSASMEQMVANIQNNTENAKQAELIALKSVEGIRKGYEATSYALSSMKRIAERVTIIGDIAFQTNILALNAAVEAARAGEQGKGFAVVAAEVRKLAERSRLAAEEIDKITLDGVRIADEAGRLLSEIVPDIEKTARLVQEIAAASMEQNAGADQINSAIQQLNQITQQNAAASEEMASSAEELSSQAQQLIDIVSFFDIGEKEILTKLSTLKNISRNIAQNTTTPKTEYQEIKRVESKSKPSKGVSIKLSSRHTDDTNYEKF